MEKAKSTLRFINYYIDKVEFYNNNNFEEDEVLLDFNIRHKIDYEKENNSFLITLDAKIFEDALENNYPFSMNVVIVGKFEVDDIDYDRINSFAEINSVAILFPYLRAVVSSYTANANIQPLILPAINIVKMLEKEI